MFILIFLVSLINVNNANKIIMQKLHIEDNLNNFLRIIQRYQEFSLLYYVDSDIMYELDKVLQITHNYFEQPCVIYYIDKKPLSTYSLQLNHLVHVVILKKPNNILPYLESSNISSSDVFLFIVTDQNWWKTKFWTMTKLEWAGNVLIMNTTQHAMSLYKVCYYCEKPKELNNIFTGHYKSILDIDINDLLPQVFQNFYGYNFKVGYLNSFPHMLCIEEDETNFYTTCKRAVGLENEMLKLMSQKLNFTYLLIPFPNPTPNINASVNVSIDYDFIMGAITVTASIAPVIYFTTTTAFQTYTFLYRPTKLSWLEVFDNTKPFDGIVWLGVLMTLILFSTSLYVSLRVKRNEPEFSLATCFRICLKSMLQQVNIINYKQIGTQTTPYLILFLMWSSLTIISTAYKSKLWAISIKTSIIEPSDVEQLLNNGYKFVVNSESHDIMTDILMNSDRLIKMVKKKLILKKNICSTINYVLNHKAAMLDQNSVLQYHALLLCENMLKDVYHHLRITRKPIRHGTHVWPLQIGAPYRKSFNNVISQIHIAGLRFKWKADIVQPSNFKFNAIPYSQTVTESSEKRNKILQGFLSSIVLYTLGNCVAILCFLFELFYHRHTGTHISV